MKLSLVEDKEEEIIRCERKKITTFMGLYQFFIVPLLVYVLKVGIQIKKAIMIRLNPTRHEKLMIQKHTSSYSHQ